MTIINRSKERIKSTGEIFTPLPLVDEILSKLPPETWAPDKTYLDPAMGDGNFLVRVIAWKIWKGSTPQQAIETTYGVDLMEDNVSHARSRVLTNAFIADLYYRTYNGDFLDQGLTHEEERKVGMHPQHDAFALKYNHIVEKNLVCHNALTYCFRFGDSSYKPLEQSIGKCQCGLCVPTQMMMCIKNCLACCLKPFLRG